MVVIDGKRYLACPFCGGEQLTFVLWSVDGGEFPAVECCNCTAGAPETIWNDRSGAGSQLPRSIQEALNTGDGSYKP